jgi:Putative MetA-pathway of phenol degradation
MDYTMLPAAVFPVLMAALFAQQAQDQQPSTSTISTDRPAVTDSSAVVPKGVFQLENGFENTNDQVHNTLDFPETLIRIGLTAATELRFTVPDYDHGPQSGFGDLAIGIKQQITNAAGFQLAAVLSLSFPTGAAGISSGKYDPSLQLPWSSKLSANWTMAGMLSVYATAQSGTRGVLGETTFLFDRQLTGPWDAFVEYAGDFPNAGGPRHLLHIGTAYKVTSQQQVDFHAGFGMSSAAPKYFVGVGYSFCFRTRR